MWDFIISAVIVLEMTLNKNLYREKSEDRFNQRILIAISKTLLVKSFINWRKAFRRIYRYWR